MNHLLDNFEPTNYKLDLNINKHTKVLSGAVTITGQAKANVFALHAVDMTIDNITVNDCNYDGAEYDGHELHFAKADINNPVEITISYHKALNENMEGAYLSTYQYEGHEDRIVTTQFESHYAREAFPCIDEPAAKATFDLTITVPDEADLILANTPANSITVENGSKTAIFETTPRMSTYLLAFIVGRFHGKTVTNSHGVTITTYAPLNQPLDSVEFANEVAARSLEFYDDEFGIKYPLSKCDQVAIPDFEAGAMENWGLVTYRESMLLADKTTTVDTKKSIALTVSHELSHQWFGDLVTMKWWDDLWLNESFATVMEYFAVDYIHPEYKIFEGFFTGDALAALRRDCLSGVQSVHQDVNDPAEIATLFDPASVYAKGARLMLMVIRAMGWKDFCKGISDYFREHQYQNTVGDDLWQALNKYADFDVKKMMHAFIERSGYPVITEGEQRRFLLDGEMDEEEWPIAEILEDMSGHYILNLTDAEFEERLARFDDLDLEEKLRLLIDRDLVSKTSLAPSASLLPLVMKFKNENSAAVWSIILTIISGLKIFFEFGSEEEARFKKFVRELISGKLDEIGIKTREGDDENTIRLRSILLALDFYAEDEENLKKLAAMYDKDFAKMDAEIRDDILDAKIYLEPGMLNKYLEAYKKENDPEIKFGLLYAGTLMRDISKLHEMMKLLEQPEIVKPQDQFYLFLYLYRNPRVKAEVFDWLTKHWEYVKEMSGDKSLENYPRYTASSVRTEAEFDKWCEFFEPMKDDPAVARAVEVGANEIRARLSLIKEDQAGVWEEL